MRNNSTKAKLNIYLFIAYVLSTNNVSDIKYTCILKSPLLDTYMHWYTHTHMHTHTRTQTHTHTPTHAHTHTHIHTHQLTLKHARAHTHTHAHACIYIHKCVPVASSFLHILRRVCSVNVLSLSESRVCGTTFWTMPRRLDPSSCLSRYFKRSYLVNLLKYRLFS